MPTIIPAWKDRMDQKNNKFVKITLWVIAIVLIIPLVIPIPPPEGTLPIEQLADPDSSFIQINEVQFHYKNSGSGETAQSVSAQSVSDCPCLVLLDERVNLSGR